MKEIASSENIEKFIQNNCIYIDKTEYIYNLIKKHERVFFSRPRRFGKSLTLNTIGTLFEKGVEPYFKGTWIYDKWTQDKYPVLHLSFLKYSTTDVDEFNYSICQTIRDFAAKLNIKKYTDDSKLDNLLRNLFTAMPDDLQIVLLIDEYDCQLTANINTPKLYEDFRNLIRKFYAVLKGEKHIKFLAVTGVTRLKDVSIFSVGSDIKDLSYEHSFSQMIGFTREEIKRFYIDYLKLGAAFENKKTPDLVTDSEIESLLDRMAEHYDSYCFDNKFRNKVFSTYSVNTFLQTLASDKEVFFGDYWYDVGGIPSILRNYMESHEIDLKKFQTSEIEVIYDDFVNPTSLLNINENVLMCQTGYLTLKSDINQNRSTLLLGFANKEVSTALCRLLGLKLFSKAVEIVTYNNVNLLETSSADELIVLLNSVLSAVVYDRNQVIHDEPSLRAIIQVYLMGKGVDVRAEQHNFKGRSDILINLDKRRIVLELKYSDDGNNVDSLLEEAVNQIREKEYGSEYLEARELVQIACVFDGSNDNRKIVRYKIVDKDMA
ncbi:PD-(D/E)XK nuclease superfamily protein [Succinivibrio dextrinosolvens DSM 3072]|uniref:PD-(D/E)XK nuclease superfamily protein n=1 Tax=Succinivibrio dextrinosolvens DSM 3072 TaxID=1123324 RepID=A0A1T4VDI4_9GAMM|nr:AAA family ATPase [Succinivibrio dextrinosolvens]SKA62956.1 PD-(D/E)XK nuclease superfamily protein [Succinivibrio dextrinosolvens DSM 3072]